ncbi:hypothetical protein [Streptomyces sp. NPDC047028]|uniref:hypothetical protein n=1 Tax=Streptomyces sp. NPDC047028 TaxID=3155793 RepID=UPI00340A313B
MSKLRLMLRKVAGRPSEDTEATAALAQWYRDGVATLREAAAAQGISLDGVTTEELMGLLDAEAQKQR